MKPRLRQPHRWRERWNPDEVNFRHGSLRMRPYLGADIGGIRHKLRERCGRSPDEVAAKGFQDKPPSSAWPAGVVVLKDMGDVIPIRSLEGRPFKSRWLPFGCHLLAFGCNSMPISARI